MVRPLTKALEICGSQLLSMMKLSKVFSYDMLQRLSVVVLAEQLHQCGSRVRCVLSTRIHGRDAEHAH